MKRLLCISFPFSLAARGKKSSVDMSNMNHIFLDWVDLNPDALVIYGHSTPGGSSSKTEWIQVEAA